MKELMFHRIAFFTEIKDAVLCNRMDKLQKTIYKAEASAHADHPKVKHALQEAQTHLSEVSRTRPLSGPSTRTSMKLKALLRLNPTTNNVLRAAFLLLGEDDRYVEVCDRRLIKNITRRKVTALHSFIIYLFVCYCKTDFFYYFTTHSKQVY